MKVIKIGIPTYYLQVLDPDVERGFLQAIQTLKPQGAEVTALHIPELAPSTYIGYVITTSEAFTYHYPWLQTQSGDYAPDVRVFFQTGILTAAPQYLRAQQARRKLIHAFKRAFKEVDILAGPTIPIPAPPFEKDVIKFNLEVTQRCIPFTSPPNATGTPSLSVPMGLSRRDFRWACNSSGIIFLKPCCFKWGTPGSKPIRCM